MAMIDYGAILRINGVIQNRNEFFMDMQKAVGWTDYPRIRYEDCDCLDEDGCSDCPNCFRHQGNHYSDLELGEWDWFDKDCHGNNIWQHNKIDRNYFVYAGDEDFTVAAYKTHIVITRKNEPTPRPMYWTYPNFSKTLNMYGTKIKIKSLNKNRDALYMRFHYKGNLYEIVYGYGIDPNQKIWNRVKKQYTDKKTIRFVDNFWYTSKKEVKK